MNFKIATFYQGLTPIQLLAVGFGLLSVVGGAILSLPVCSAAGAWTPFLDALFTATSAVTTTGLGVVDTGTHYNRVGQWVILLLFQVGGLGYMVFIALAVLGLSGKLSLSNRILLRESMGRPTTVELVKFAKVIIMASLLIELAGTVALALVFARRVPVGEAVFSGLFHSVSAFCTAGFSIYADSFCRYADNVFCNVVLFAVMIAGGLGFFVLYDLSAFAKKVARREYPRRLATHTKLVLALTVLFSVLGMAGIFFFEHWDAGLTVGQRALYSAFQSVTTTSTTGFNSIDIGKMSVPSLFLVALLMFVGAAPGGTGGGVKVTTLGVIVMSLVAQLRGRPGVHIFRRRVEEEIVFKAMAVVFIAASWLALAVLALAITEQASFLAILFEAGSALGTVGLSMGLTPELSAAGKIIIILTMLVGRIGPLGIALSIIQARKTGAHQYAPGEVLVG